MLFDNPSSRIYRRYFMIAGITICVESLLDLGEFDFKPEFTSFEVNSPGNDIITLRHYFGLPDLAKRDFGEELYRKLPWAISYNDERKIWTYLGILSGEIDINNIHCLAEFSDDYQQGVIYNPIFMEGFLRSKGWPSLSLLPTDQIWLAPVLADRHAVLMHAGAVKLNGQGLLFVGHSEAGKSTTMNLLKTATEKPIDGEGIKLEILCDDRNIVRRMNNTWHVCGTWSHGDVAEVSSSSGPLRAILFLEKDTRNELVRLTDRKEIWQRLLGTLIKPMVTSYWWNKELDVLEGLINSIPCYKMHFDKSGAIVSDLIKLTMNDQGDSEYLPVKSPVTSSLLGQS